MYGMWACGIHDTYDQELAERAVQVVPGRLAELSGGEIAKLAFALVEEDVREGGLFEEIKAHAATDMGAMFPRDIAKLLYALGRAQVRAIPARPLLCDSLGSAWPRRNGPRAEDWWRGVRGRTSG